MAVITFNKELYSVQCVNAAIEAFKNFADFKTSENHSYITVSVANCRYDENQTVAEFGNYIIDSMNSANGNN